MKPLRVGTIFSGIGAFEWALKLLNVNHEVVFACDIDKHVKKSYFANYDIKEENWFSDITKLDGNLFQNKIDILVGGSPCQSFSTAGLRKGFQEYRGNLFFEYIRILTQTKPKVFIFENVSNLMVINKGKDFEIVKNAFTKAGYHIHFKILNPVNYNMPQKRNRVFIVGFWNDFDFQFPKSIKLEKTVHDFLDKEVDVKYLLSPTQVVYAYKPHHFNNKPYLNPKISPCITTNAYHCRASQGCYVLQKDKIRRLTPRETLRLMGFTDDFKIVVSDSQAYKQAGNSIVVNVLMHLFKEIKKIFDLY